ncbi:putative zinc-binding metallopeptidase [Pseudoalteromonas sp. B193]
MNIFHYGKNGDSKTSRFVYIKIIITPLNTTIQEPESGLSFDFIADRNVSDHFVKPYIGQDVVFTGHDCGHITINLAEADDVARSQAKIAMGERYRTLLGHFRHELGHYYFDQLIANSPKNMLYVSNILVMTN